MLVKNYLIYDPSNGTILRSGTCLCGSETCPDHLLAGYPGMASVETPQIPEEEVGQHDLLHGLDLNAARVQNGEVILDSDYISAQQEAANAMNVGMDAYAQLATLSFDTFMRMSDRDKWALMYQIAKFATYTPP
jgi:hypothetical protein